MRTTNSLLIYLSLIIASASAMGGNLSPPDHQELGSVRFIFTGEVTRDDVSQFQKAIAEIGDTNQWIIVDFNSDGGDAIAAIEIGKLLRTKGVWTGVRSGDTCASSCVLMFLSGVQRIVGIGSRIGIHRPYFDHSYFADLSRDEARTKYNHALVAVENYITDMAIPKSFFEFMTSIPSNQIVWLSQEEIEKFKISGADPVDEEWEWAKMVNKLGEEEAIRQRRIGEFMYQCSIVEQRPTKECSNKGEQLFGPLIKQD